MRNNNKNIINTAELIGTLIINGFNVVYEFSSEENVIYINGGLFIDLDDDQKFTVSSLIFQAKKFVESKNKENVKDFEIISFKDGINKF